MNRARLTPRQREVLDLLAKRYSNQQIADALGISLEGAKWHVREILEATGASSREEAAEMWRAETGLPRRLWRMTWGAGKAATILGGAAGVVVVAIAVFIVFRGGSDDEPPVAPEPTATATGSAPVPTATLKPTPGTVGTLLPPSRSTGAEFIDYVTAHLESNVALQFADLEGQSLPCSATTSTTWPACPAGAAPGTPVLSIITFQCEIGWSELTADRRVTLPEDRLTLHSVVRVGLAYTRPPAAEAAPDYWMLLTNAAASLPPGFALAVKGSKIVSFGRSCGTFETLKERLLEDSTGYLLPPP